MVIKGGASEGGKPLAIHLGRLDTNERRNEVLDLRDVASESLGGALREMEAVASANPNCKKPVYHASINVPVEERMTDEQKLYAVDKLEKQLGFTGQPRIVVVHEKNDGREHVHVVWSRLNLDTMKVIQTPHNYRAHEYVARMLEREFGHKRVQGAHVERDGQPRPERTPSHKEHQQAERTGLKPGDARQQLTELWRATDSGEAFQAAMEDKGWLLARGDRRDFVAIDRHGGVHSLSRRIEGATAKDIRTRFASLDRDQLPSVAEGRAAQYKRFGRPVDRTKPPKTPKPGRQQTVVRRIGDVRRPERGTTQTAGPAKETGRLASGSAREGMRTAVGVADGVFNALLGESVKPRRRRKDAEDRPHGSSPGLDVGVQQDEAEKSQRRQRYLRQHSREVSEEKQHEADLDLTKGRERTRGE